MRREEPLGQRAVRELGLQQLDVDPELGRPAEREQRRSARMREIEMRAVVEERGLLLGAVGEAQL